MAGDRPLTPRQLDVVRLLASGRTYREMARLLDISQATLAVHVDRVYLRLGVHDREAAVQVAVARGLIEPLAASPEDTIQR